MSAAVSGPEKTTLVCIFPQGFFFSFLETVHQNSFFFWLSSAAFEISPDQGLTHATALGTQSLNHCTSRESPQNTLFTFFPQCLSSRMPNIP